MRVLSMCDGMSCGQIALRELGIIPEIYYASEIDKFAIAQTQLNFPDTFQLGDMVHLKYAMTWKDEIFRRFMQSPYIRRQTKDKFYMMRCIDWSKIDLILAGTPCQGFSFAGKGLAFDDPRSRLFFVFVDILNHIKRLNPDVKFLLENVRMKKEYMRIISEYVGVFPVNINSNLVSAQNRDRWYWSNIRVRQEGLFGDLVTDIPQPEDRGILLKDILEMYVDRKYFLSGKSIKYMEEEFAGASRFDKFNNDVEGKSGSITANHAKGIPHGVIKYPNGFICPDGKAPTQRSPTGRCLNKKHNFQVIQLNPSKESGGRQPYQQNRVYDINGLSPALMAGLSSGSNAIYDNRIICHNRMPRSSKTGKGGTGPLSRLDGKTYCLAAEMQVNAVEYLGRIRRLTPTECGRLQTIPDWYKWECSETQQYKMLGNGWTVEAIKHILSFISTRKDLLSKVEDAGHKQK